MPYLTPQGDEILTPEEQAARDAAMASVVTGAGGGNAPIPPPQTAPAADPFAGVTASAEVGPPLGPPAQSNYSPESSASYQYQDPIPPPAQTETYTPSYPSSSDAAPTSYASRPYNPNATVTDMMLPEGNTTTPWQTVPNYVAPTDATPYQQDAAPPPTPYSWQPNAMLNDQATERRAPAPLLPNALGGRGPLGPEYVNASPKTGWMGDLGSGARWAPPIPPPPTTTNWWDGLTDAAGNVIPGLVQWATPGLASGPANSARQAQDAVGGVLRDASLPPVRQDSLDQLNQGLGLTQPDTGISWQDVLSPGDWIPEPQTYRDATGREMLGVGDAMFLPDPMGGIGTAGFADDVARVMNSADDAARVANTVDDAARMRTTATGDIPEPPTGKTLAEPEPVVDTAGSTTGDPNAAPVSGSTVPSGSKSGGFRIPRLTRGRVAAGAAGLVVGAGLVNNVIQTGRNAGQANQPPGGSTPTGTPTLNPDRYARESALLDSVTSAEWQRRKDDDPDYWYSITKPAVLVVNGVRQKAIASSVVPGHYMGYFDEAGNAHPIGGDVSTKEFLDLLVANAAEAPPGWPDNTPSNSTTTPDQSGGTSSSGSTSSGTPAQGTTLSDVAIPTPDSVSSGSSVKSSGDWNNDWNSDWSSGSSKKSSKRSSSSSDSGSWDDREFTADDFMDTADGDRKKARMMAQIANKRRRGKRKGDTTSSGIPAGFWDGFPFNRPPTPIREHVLTALQESMAKGRK